MALAQDKCNLCQNLEIIFQYQTFLYTFNTQRSLCIKGFYLSLVRSIQIYHTEKLSFLKRYKKNQINQQQHNLAIR